MASPGKFAIALYPPAVAVGKVQAYEVVGIPPCKEETSAWAVLVQFILVLNGPEVTFQEIVPVGNGFVERLPPTKAVNVVVPPKLCGVEAESEIVGLKLAIVKVIGLEVAVM